MLTHIYHGSERFNGKKKKKKNCDKSVLAGIGGKLLFTEGDVQPIVQSTMQGHASDCNEDMYRVKEDAEERGHGWCIYRSLDEDVCWAEKLEKLGRLCLVW